MRVLFVCMGNICRSPTAEGVFRRALQERAPHLDIQIDSAGTHDYHVGEAPDSRAIKAARRRGIDLTALRARRITPEDFEIFDLILGMDEDNLRELRSRAHASRHGRIRLMMEFAPAAVEPRSTRSVLRRRTGIRASAGFAGGGCGRAHRRNAKAS